MRSGFGRRLRALMARRGSDGAGSDAMFPGGVGGGDVVIAGRAGAPVPSEPPLPEDPPPDTPLHRREAGDSRPLVAQPAIAMRARVYYQRISLGLVLAVAGALAMVGASATMLRLNDAGTFWPAVGNAAAALNALVAFMQWRLWRLALKEWEGTRDVALSSWLGLSWAGVWVSAAGAVVVPVAADQVVRVSVRADAAWWLALSGMVLVVLGTIMAGVQRFRPDGPPGVPPLIRRNRHIHHDRVARPAPVLGSPVDPGSGSAPRP